MVKQFGFCPIILKVNLEDSPDSRQKRLAQATRTAQIYQRLRSEGRDLVVVLGDLNDIPDSSPLQPLLADTDLQDVSDHPSFDTGEFKEERERMSAGLEHLDWVMTAKKLTIYSSPQTCFLEFEPVACLEKEHGLVKDRKDRVFTQSLRGRFMSPATIT